MAENRDAPPARSPRQASTIGLPRDGWRDVYHTLLTMPFWGFILVLAAAYLVINLIFASLYVVDPGGVANARPGDWLDAFFFSAQTLASVGYGEMWPRSRWANGWASAEMFLGLLNVGAATGLVFARISRPTSRVMFSRNAVVTPMNGVPTLMFRAANRRRNLVIEAEITVSLFRETETAEGMRLRRFDELTLHRARSPQFFLTWQIMHPINKSSPLYGETIESLRAKDAELVVILRGLDETFATTIHARHTYYPQDIVWNARLADILVRKPGGGRHIDFRSFHDIIT